MPVKKVDQLSRQGQTANQSLKVPYLLLSVSLPMDDVAQNKCVSSELKTWIKGMYLPTLRVQFRSRSMYFKLNENHSQLFPLPFGF